MVKIDYKINEAFLLTAQNDVLYAICNIVIIKINI